MARFALVTVAVPALNEAESLEELFQRVSSTMQAVGQEFEFLVIDDGSTDGTFDLLARLRESHPQIRCIRHAKPHGKSMGLMQAFNAARGDVVVCIDADLQDQPEDIPRLLDKIAEGWDMVGGWRHNRKDSPSKCFVSAIYNKIVHKLCDCPAKDINCGLKAMTRATAQKLDLRGDMHRIMPLLARSHGLSFVEIPVDHAPRKHGRSRYRLLRHRGLLDLFAFYAMQSTQLRPFHVFFEMGVVLFGLGCLSLLGSGVGLLLHWEILPLVFAVFGMLFIFVGALLPLFGFSLEVITSQMKDKAWRSQLISREI
ncbi:MAG TPA: glycosyltransferase family 2 protein [Nitratidesulfovibrio sp.]|nr:glycosyltransferase family 2 protein [Nitratidesulfovibrio sp.]